MKTKFLNLVIILVLLNSISLVQSIFSQWEPDVRLTNANGHSYTGTARCVAAIGNNLHVVWYDYRDGDYEIYYKRSTDGGTSWEADTRLTNNVGISMSPTVAVSGLQVNVAWYDKRDGDYEIYYKRSTDGGTSWEADTRLTNSADESFSPSLAVSGTQVNIVWQDKRDGNYEIYYKRSTNGGTSWEADTRLTNNTAYSSFPSLTLYGMLLHVVWHDFRDGSFEIYYKRSTDGGTTWEVDTRLTNSISGASSTSISISGSQINVVWKDYRDGNDEIYYKRSIDGGTTWGADTRLTNNIANSYSPSVDVTGLQVYVVWQDKRDGNWEIYYKRSTDGGTTWEADTRLSNNFSEKSSPSVAFTGSLVSVIWYDNRDGNFEIYYKRKLPVNGITNIPTKFPSSFVLEQNYPNPFNPTTNIKYTIGKNGFVTLKVFDVMGREAAVLVNEKRNVGNYETVFDGRNLTSGIYFYKLITEGFTETKRMLMIK